MINMKKEERFFTVRVRLHRNLTMKIKDKEHEQKLRNDNKAKRQKDKKVLQKTKHVPPKTPLVLVPPPQKKKRNANFEAKKSKEASPIAHRTNTTAKAAWMTGPVNGG